MVIMLVISFSWATEGYDNLAKLVKSKVSEDVIIAFINSSNVNYVLTADDIIHLTEMGASSKVITAAIEHKKPAPVEAASAPQPVPSDNTDNAVVYESVPPPADSWYDGYWQYPTDNFIYSYPGWPYYGYHQRRGYDHSGYSHGHGNGGQSARTGSVSKSVATNKRSK